MDALDVRNIGGFAARDLQGIDQWRTWAPVPVNMTELGTCVYFGRSRQVGAQCFFNITVTTTISTASTAGLTYFPLPLTAVGLGGQVTVFDATALTPINVGCIDVANSRVYTPTWGATINTIKIGGWFEVKS